jgi:hypothetical protein
MVYFWGSALNARSVHDDDGEMRACTATESARLCLLEDTMPREGKSMEPLRSRPRATVDPLTDAHALAHREAHAGERPEIGAHCHIGQNAALTGRCHQHCRTRTNRQIHAIYGLANIPLAA